MYVAISWASGSKIDNAIRCLYHLSYLKRQLYNYTDNYAEVWDFEVWDEVWDIIMLKFGIFYQHATGKLHNIVFLSCECITHIMILNTIYL